MELLLKIAVGAFFVAWGAYVGFNAQKVRQDWFFSDNGAIWLRVLAAISFVVGIAIIFVV